MVNKMKSLKLSKLLGRFQHKLKEISNTIHSSTS
jgi:hypothetical protein